MTQQSILAINSDHEIQKIAKFFSEFICFLESLSLSMIWFLMLVIALGCCRIQAIRLRRIFYEMSHLCEQHAGDERASGRGDRLLPWVPWGLAGSRWTWQTAWARSRTGIRAITLPGATTTIWAIPGFVLSETIRAAVLWAQEALLPKVVAEWDFWLSSSEKADRVVTSPACLEPVSLGGWQGQSGEFVQLAARPRSSTGIQASMPCKGCQRC